MFKLVTVKKRTEFALFRRQANSLTSNFFIVKYYANNLDVLQLGFIVSKKVSKLAVERNLVKRRMKAAIRNLKPQFNINYNILIIAKNKIVKAKYSEIDQDLKNIFMRIYDQQVSNIDNKAI